MGPAAGDRFTRQPSRPTATPCSPLRSESWGCHPAPCGHRGTSGRARGLRADLRPPRADLAVAARLRPVSR